MKKIVIILVILWITVQPVFCLEYYNFKIEQYEEVTEPIVDYSSYIPQDAACQGLYKVYIKTGNIPCEAAIKVLEEISE